MLPKFTAWKESGDDDEGAEEDTRERRFRRIVRSKSTITSLAYDL